MIGGDAEPHVPPASRAESACASPMRAARSSAAAGAPIRTTRRARHSLLRWHRVGIEPTAFQNSPIGDLLALRTAPSDPAAAPLSP
jgi:hypothetical protein